MSRGWVVLFVHKSDVFFGLAECCVGKCSEGIEVGFRLSVYVFGMWDGGHFFCRMSLRVRWPCLCRVCVCC